MIGSKTSQTSTIIAASCLLLVGCTQSNSRVGETARPVTTPPAQVATAGETEPRVAPAAKPVETARLPAEATPVEPVPAAAPLTIAPAPPKPKPRQDLARNSARNSAQKPARKPVQNLAKPAPPAAESATVELEPAAAKPPAASGTMVASRTSVDPAPETGAPVADSSAVEVIDLLGRKTMAVLSDPSKTPAERQKFFQGLVADHVDIPMLAKFLAGRHWRGASAEQRTAYVSAFTDFMLQVFARQLGGAELDDFEVLGSKPVGRRDVMVMTRLHRNGKPLKVDWRMRRRDNRFLVIDVTAAGVSMAMTRRQEFAAIIRANGGRFDGLIAKLQEFVSKAS